MRICHTGVYRTNTFLSILFTSLLTKGNWKKFKCHASMQFDPKSTSASKLVKENGEAGSRIGFTTLPEVSPNEILESVEAKITKYTRETSVQCCTVDQCQILK